MDQHADRDAVDAAALAGAILRAAHSARNEEELRIGVESALAHVRRRLGIKPRYESSYQSVVHRGYSDAVYGHLVLEYKRPGSLSQRSVRRTAIEELSRYMHAEASPYGLGGQEALARMVGVATDGTEILFLRYRGIDAQSSDFQVAGQRDVPVGFDVLGPYPIDAESVSLFISYLRALRRRPLTPESLVSEFGPKSEAARTVVRALMRRLMADLAVSNPEPHVETLFGEWQRLFGVVYGTESKAARKSATDLAHLYDLTGEPDLARTLFVVHTYYALLMKLIAAELVSLQRSSVVDSALADMAIPSTGLRAEFEHLESGGTFAQRGISNFLEADFFGWYLVSWDTELEFALKDLVSNLAEFEPATGTLLAEPTRDLLKKLYQYLLPAQLRHDLGEFYTPDWLAELTINEAEYFGDVSKRFLDPACGSGTFLVLAIYRARRFLELHPRVDGDPAQLILASIIGFDQNPLAVIAARTNYLLALGPLLRRAGDIELPVYLCDSVLVPEPEVEESDGQRSAFFDDLTLSTSVGEFVIPRALANKTTIGEVCAAIEDSIRSGYTEEEFKARLAPVVPADEHVLGTVGLLYSRLRSLHAQGRDGIWARLIRNSFAPLFVGEVDYVVGNPPWVRWGYLSESYRNATKALWRRLGLFSLSGIEASLGSGEKDFSMLFLYACADRYLRSGGTLAFLITQEVFKSKGAGEGFRRFRIGNAGSHLGVLKAHDLVQVRPFEGAANKTAMIVLTKGQPTTYPVPYTVWRRFKGEGPVPTDVGLGEAIARTSRSEALARPVGGRTGPWQTADATSGAIFVSLAGTSAYTARRGAATDPYGVFWLRLLQDRVDGTVLVENLPERGKSPIPKVQAVIEDRLLYPAIRGADVRRWGVEPSGLVLLTQDPLTRKPIPEADMKALYPRAYAYLQRWRDVLLGRGSRTVRTLAERTEPWAMFGVGEYTFSPYRVVWRRMGSDMIAAVISDWLLPFGRKPILATDTTAFIPVEREDEAHFLAGILNSSPIRAYIQSFSSGGRGFGAPSVVSHLNLPAYDATLETHNRIREIAAALAAPDLHAGIGDRSLDLAVADLFGLQPADVEALKVLAPHEAPVRPGREPAW